MARKKRLRDEIAQATPFETAEVEAFLNLVRTADRLLYEANVFFRAFGLTMTQYNVLRILRGAQPDGHPSLEIGRRLITRVPDVTRLIDRLEAMGLAERVRSTEDRRVVRVRITRKGLNLLARIDSPVREHHRRLLEHMGDAKLQRLTRLLEEARARAARPEDLEP